jgi:hypothetical protein
LRWRAGGWICAVFGLSILVASAAERRAAAQTSNSTASSSSLPRTPEGKPDFSGIWQGLTTASWDIQDHSDGFGAPAGQGIVEGNDIPYKPDALAQRQKNFASRATDDLTESSCFMPGVPRATYMPYPFEIVQNPESVAIRYEFAHAVRLILFQGSHPKDWPDFWMGDSRGTWDGETLVVDVRMIDDRTWFDHAGNFHSAALHVTERYHFIDRDHLSYEATIEDPNVFTRPWKISLPLYRRLERNVRVLEHECAWYNSQEKYKTAVPYKPPKK